ncbi:MAG: phosphatase PAP2 family protein [Candidatus Omnitrophota bacterium]|nr:phosphatase PAP2 family protein [Candidatus Omnitrophota bacterium]
MLDVFNHDIKNPVFDFLFPLITRSAEIVVFFPLCLLILIWDKKKGKRITMLLVIAYLLSRLSTLFLKHLTHRPRPFLIYPDLNVLGKAIFSAFPSGHVTLACAIAIVLGKKYRDWQWLMWIWIALVSVSRMYMGLHYPTDVMAGIVVGLTIGYITNFLERIYETYKKKGKLK